MYNPIRAIILIVFVIGTAFTGCTISKLGPDAGPDHIDGADSGQPDIDADGEVGLDRDESDGDAGTARDDLHNGGDENGVNNDAGDGGGGSDGSQGNDIGKLKFAGPDILFVIDNTSGMVSKQLQLARSFAVLVTELDLEFGPRSFHAAVVTTGLESPGCPLCQPDYPYSCINETGEGGRFQDRVGHNSGTEENPSFEFTADPSCRVVSAQNVRCFYDAGERQRNRTGGRQRMRLRARARGHEARAPTRPAWFLQHGLFARGGTAACRLYQ